MESRVGRIITISFLVTKKKKYKPLKIPLSKKDVYTGKNVSG